jgi:hypothetical protein
MNQLFVFTKPNTLILVYSNILKNIKTIITKHRMRKLQYVWQPFDEVYNRVKDFLIIKNIIVSLF